MYEYEEHQKKLANAINRIAEPPGPLTSEEAAKKAQEIMTTEIMPILGMIAAVREKLGLPGLPLIASTISIPISIETELAKAVAEAGEKKQAAGIMPEQAAAEKAAAEKAAAEKAATEKAAAEKAAAEKAAADKAAAEKVEAQKVADTTYSNSKQKVEAVLGKDKENYLIDRDADQVLVLDKEKKPQFSVGHKGVRAYAGLMDNPELAKQMLDCANAISKKPIVILCDDPKMREHIQTIAGEAGIEVKIAKNEEEYKELTAKPDKEKSAGFLEKLKDFLKFINPYEENKPPASLKTIPKEMPTEVTRPTTPTPKMPTSEQESTRPRSSQGSQR